MVTQTTCQGAKGMCTYHDSMTNSPQLILLVPGKLSKTIKSQPSSHRLASDVG